MQCLSDEETELSELKDKVDEVNEQNETVQKAINSFNESTVTVNGLKRRFFNELRKR